jgi:hypothetical protein
MCHILVLFFSRLALCCTYWRTFTWEQLVDIVQIWPAVDGVAKGRSADDFVRSARAINAKTSLRKLRIYVNPVRSPDTMRFSMSPKACSELLSTCKDSIRHVCLSFAPNPKLTGLEASASEIASSLSSLELFITTSTRDWAIRFLSQCRVLETLTLKYLSADMEPIAPASLSDNCKFLHNLRLSVSASNEWRQYSSVGSVCNLTLEISVQKPYPGFCESSEVCIQKCGSVAGALVNSVAATTDFSEVCEEIKKCTPPHVGINLNLLLTVPARSYLIPGGIRTVHLNPVITAVKMGQFDTTKSIQALKTALAMGGNIYAEDAFGNRYCPAFCWLIAHSLVLPPFKTDPEAFKFGSYLVSMTELLLEAQWDPTAPTFFQDFAKANADEFSPSHGHLSNKMNAFFIAATCRNMLEALKLLISGPTLQKLRSEGKEHLALVGPDKEGILTVSRHPETLDWLAQNVDLLLDPTLTPDQRARSGRDILNHTSRTSGDHILSRFLWRRPPNFELISKLMQAGADPFSFSFSTPSMSFISITRTHPTRRRI